MKGRSLVLWFFGSLVLTAGDPHRYSYWVEPCTRPESFCQSTDPQLAEWAFQAWRSAAPGAIDFAPLKDRAHARIRLLWGSSEQGMYGEARPIIVDGKKGAEVYVRPAPLSMQDDKLLRDAVVYLTCLHETGHALGLPHTAQFDDIMYSFQFGGDIPEYFARYRRKLRTRDDIKKNPGLSEADVQAIRSIASSRGASLWLAAETSRRLAPQTKEPSLPPSAGSARLPESAPTSVPCDR